MDAVKPTETGIATGMNTVVRTVGGVIGAQVGAVLLAANTVAGTSVPAGAGFVDAFWIGAPAPGRALRPSPIFPGRRAACPTPSRGGGAPAPAPPAPAGQPERA